MEEQQAGNIVHSVPKFSVLDRSTESFFVWVKKYLFLNYKAKKIKIPQYFSKKVKHMLMLKTLNQPH